MASLYIKDSETSELATRRAKRLGTTKTEAVRSALRTVEAEFVEVPRQEQSTLEWLREYRKKHPLSPQTALKADKAFYDWLSGEDDVPDLPAA